VPLISYNNLSSSDFSSLVRQTWQAQVCNSHLEII
jgi:hypothetical protein